MRRVVLDSKWFLPIKKDKEQEPCDFTHVAYRTEAADKTDKQTHRLRKQCGGCQRAWKGRVRWAQGVKCAVAGGDWTSGVGLRRTHGRRIIESYT